MEEPTEEQLVISGLRGQIQFLMAQVQLLERDLKKQRDLVRSNSSNNPVSK